MLAAQIGIRLECSFGYNIRDDQQKHNCAEQQYRHGIHLPPYLKAMHCRSLAREREARVPFLASNTQVR
jgi:hypothetical protein